MGRRRNCAHGVSAALYHGHSVSVAWGELHPFAGELHTFLDKSSELLFCMHWR